MIYNRPIKKLLNDMQIDLIGFAKLEKYQDDIVRTGGSIVQGYATGISIGIKLQNAIVDYLPKRFDSSIACEYRLHAYEVVNQRLNFITSTIASFISKKGYRALPIPAADRINSEKAYASVSHKMIAHIAGLGWIGKNCLLVTSENGPRVRFATILTDIPLRAIDSPMVQKCGDCVECVKICPSRAILGRNYIQSEEREKRFEFTKCENYFEKLKEKQEYVVCGMCLYACPYGKDKSRSPSPSWLGRMVKKPAKHSS
jgi:epoxyqueuosine reductase